MQDGGPQPAKSELRKLLECFANRGGMNIIFDPANTLINDGNDNKELYIIFSMLALYTCHSSYSVKQGTSIIVCFRNCMSFGRPTLNSGRCILTG